MVSVLMCHRQGEDVALGLVGARFGAHRERAAPTQQAACDEQAPGTRCSKQPIFQQKPRGLVGGDVVEGELSEHDHNERNGSLGEEYAGSGQTLLSWNCRIHNAFSCVETCVDSVWAQGFDACTFLFDYDSVRGLAKSRNTARRA